MGRKTKWMHRWISFLCIGALVLAPVPVSGVSATEASKSAQTLVDNLREKLKKLTYISVNYDSEVNRLTQATETLVTTLGGLNYAHATGGGTAYFNRVGSISDPANNTLYVTDEFFSTSRFGLTVPANATAEQLAEINRKLSINQQAVMLHEAVHADQGLTFKAIQGLGQIPVIGGKDKAEGEAYMIEYVLLKFLGGDDSWVEANNALLEIKDHFSSLYDLSSLSGRERFQKRLGMDGTLRLLDGGIDKAYDRLKRYEALLPGGKTTRLKLGLTLVDDAGKPVSGYPVKVEAFHEDPEVTVGFTDLKGQADFTQMTWTDFAKTFVASRTYYAYLQYEPTAQQPKGRRVILTKFTGESLFNPALFIRNTNGSYTVNLGTFTLSGVKKPPVGESQQKVQQRLGINVIGPDGQGVPKESVKVSQDRYSSILGEAGIAYERAFWYLGKIVKHITATTGSQGGVSRTLISNGADVTVTLPQQKPLPYYSQGWAPGMKDSEKLARFNSTLQQADQFFREAMGSHGVVEGSGSGYSLQEYALNRMGIVQSSEPTIYRFFYNGTPYGNDGTVYPKDPVKLLWEDLLKRQSEEAVSKAKGIAAELQQRQEQKTKLEAEYYPAGYDRAFKLVLPYAMQQPGAYGFVFSGSSTEAQMAEAISAKTAEYDGAIAETAAWLERMGTFYGDAELWKAHQQYRDLYAFVGRDALGLSSGFDALFDMGNYEMAGYYYDSLQKSRTVVLAAMESARDIALEAQALSSIAAGKPNPITDVASSKPLLNQDPNGVGLPEGYTVEKPVTPPVTPPVPPVTEVQPDTILPHPPGETINPNGGGDTGTVGDYGGTGWEEWTIRTLGNGLPISQDVRTRTDSPWKEADGILTYQNNGAQRYANDFILSLNQYDISDIEVTFEATGSFRTDYGYTGPVIAFTDPGNVFQTVQPTGTYGVGGWYSWEAGKKDNGLLLFNGSQNTLKPHKFIDYGDQTYRPYTLRILEGILSLRLPDGTVLIAMAPGADTAAKLPLVIAFRTYDQGKEYSLSIRNLKIIEH